MLNLAMNAGILSSIFDGIKGIVDFFVNFFDILKGLFQALIIYLFAPIYYLFMGICSIVNFAEMLFKKLAGIDPIITATGEQMNILDVFVRSNEIWGLFVSILVLSIVLLFLFTIVAVIKSEFAIDAKGSAKGPIIARSLKSLAMFIIVPVVSLLGVYAVNAITDTINSMMKGSDDTSMVNQIFYTMAYNANKARINDDFADYIRNCDSNYRNNNGGKFKGSQEDIAYAIDQAFKTNQTHSKSDYKEMDLIDDMIDAHDFSALFMQPSWFSNASNGWKTYSIWDLTQVNFYFSILDMDWVIGFGGAIAITFMLLSMCCVLVKRIFELVILLLLAVPMISLAPLDGGSASKSWQKEFMKRVLAIVAPVFSINMYFIMVPLFQKISIFGAPGVGSALTALAIVNPYVLVYDAIFQLLIICVGMSVVKTASALLCNLLGIQDLVKEGGDQTKKAVSTVASVAATVATGGAAAGAMLSNLSAGKGQKQAQKKYDQALKSGNADEIASAKANLDSANATKARSQELMKDKGAAFMEKAAPEAYKGFKEVKGIYKDRNKTNKEKDIESKAKEEETKAAALEKVADNKEQKELKKTHQSRAYQYRESVYQEKGVDVDGMTRAQTQGYIDHNDTRGQRWAKGGSGEEGLKKAKQNYAATQETYVAGTSPDGTPIYAQRTKAGMEQLAASLQSIIAALEADKAKLKAADRTTTAALEAGDAQGARFEARRDASGQIVRDGQGGIDSDVTIKPQEERTPLVGPKVAKGKRIVEDVMTLGAAEIPRAVIQHAEETGKRKAGTSDAQLSASETTAHAGGRDEAYKTATNQLASEVEDKKSGLAAITSDKPLKADFPDMSDKVEQGVKEAGHDLARQIADAMRAGKLNVDGINQMRVALETFTKQFQAAQKTKDTSALEDALKELKEVVGKLAKK